LFFQDFAVVDRLMQRSPNFFCTRTT